EKELKKLTKKWRSLPDDLAAAQKQIVNLYVEQADVDDLQEYRAAFFNGKRAAILQTIGDDCEVVKMRLDCASIGTNSKVRLVFVAVYVDSTVTFIELFAKNEKAREDRQRIKRYLPS